jgi:hypothetical protein
VFIVHEGIYGLDEYESAPLDRDALLDYIDNLLDSMTDDDRITIRRADLFDAQSEEDVRFERPKLTLLQGGKS